MKNEIQYIDIHLGVKFDGISVTFKLHRKSLSEPGHKLMDINFHEKNNKIDVGGHIYSLLLKEFKGSDIFKQIKSEYKIEE